MTQSFAFEDLDIRYLGPTLDQGTLPTLLYFALSAKSSLEEDPFNQPAQFFLTKHAHKARVFSVTLPYHEEGHLPQHALTHWSTAFQQGHDLLADFLANTTHFVEHLYQKNIIEAETFAISGLSRGAFIGLHILARLAWAKKIVCFAPLIDLAKAKEFAPFHNPQVAAYSCLNLAPKLFTKSIFATIGNKDDRVSTRRCFDFIEKAAETAYEHRLRSPNIQLHIYPSIGHQGHGTPPSIFQAGIDTL